jgi:hypothetical protein
MRDKMFERKKGAVFGERGITRKVAECDGAFFAYEQGDHIPQEWLYVGDPTKQHVGVGLPERPERDALSDEELTTVEELSDARAARAPGLMMRRFPVPGADPFLFAQQRPERAIWSGGHKKPHRHSTLPWGARNKHEDIERTKKHPVTRGDVERGLTPDELAWFQKRTGWTVNYGADHFGKRTNKPHLHVDPGKYLFVPNSKVAEPYGHDHQNYTAKRLARHLWQDHEWPEVRYTDSKRTPSDPMSRELLKLMHGAHGGKHIDESRFPPRRGPRGGRGRTVVGHPEIDEWHEHETKRDRHFYAKRLSSHPMGFERIAKADFVCFAFEGELKEAALVSAGWATFSCPAVGMWDAPELDAFVHNHLIGKLVLIIPDSDALQNENVIMQTMLAKERLNFLGALAATVIPTPEQRACKLHGQKRSDKRGVDDYLADGGRVEDMTWFTREPGTDLSDWLQEHDKRSPSGRMPRRNRIDHDAVILRHLTMIANKDGETGTSLHSAARYVRPELEQLRAEEGKPPFKSHEFAVVDVERAVERMDKVYGAIEGFDTLADRRMKREHDEWSGELTVHPDLRARDDDTRSVADLLKEIRK